MSFANNTSRPQSRLYQREEKDEDQFHRAYSRLAFRDMDRERLAPFVQNIHDADARKRFFGDFRLTFHPDKCQYDPNSRLVQDFPSFGLVQSQLQANYPLDPTVCGDMFTWANAEYGRLNRSSTQASPTPETASSRAPRARSPSSPPPQRTFVRSVRPRTQGPNVFNQEYASRVRPDAGQFDRWTDPWSLFQQAIAQNQRNR